MNEKLIKEIAEEYSWLAGSYHLRTMLREYTQRDRAEKAEARVLQVEERCGDVMMKLSNAETALAASKEEIHALHTRLEDNVCFDSKGNKIEVEAGSIPDGIYCRNETIKLQDAEIAALTARLAEFEQEPRAWWRYEGVYADRFTKGWFQSTKPDENAIPLYARKGDSHE